MNEKLTDERISAYLDDELSAEERADIERQLAESADLRLAVEELRALHAGMQSLPRYKLESSIADRVLQLAEREILVGGRADGGRADGGRTDGDPIVADTNGQALAAAENRPQPASPPTSAPLSQHESVRHEAWFSWRNLVWSASAAAVAALVTNYYHVNNPNYSTVVVAAGDSTQPGDGNAAKQEAEQSNARAIKDRPDAEIAAASQGSAKIESAKPESAELRSTDSGLPSTESSAESALSKKPGAAADGNASADRSADKRNTGAGSAGAANADAFDRPTRGGNSGNEAPDTTMAADSAAGASSLAQRRARAGHSSKQDANAQSADESHGFGGGDRSAADGNPAVDGEAEGDDGAAGDLAMNDEAASAALSGRSQMFLGGPSISSSATTNVVTLAVSPEAWQRREFDKLLIANRVAMVSDTSNSGANDGGANNGGPNNGGSAAEEMFVLDVTQEQFAELLKAVDVRSDAFAVIKEFAVDEEVVAGEVAAGAALAASDAAPSDAAPNDPARSVAAAPSIAQGALRSTDVRPRARGTPRETNPMRSSRGSDNPPPGAARPNALPPSAVEAPAVEAPAVDAPRSVDPAPTPEPKAMPKPQALPEEQSPPPAKATEAEPDGGRLEKAPDKKAPADAPADKPTRVKSPEKKPGDDRPAPAADAARPPSAAPDSPKVAAPPPEALRPEPQKGETMPAESESANSAPPAPRSLAGEGAQTEKKAEAKSLRQDDPERAPRSRANSLVPDSSVPDSFAPDDAAKEKFEALAAPEGFARRIVPRSRTSSAEAQIAPSRYPPEAVEPPSPVPPPAAPNKAIPDAVAEDAHADKPATVESGKPNRKQIVDGAAEVPAVDRVAGPSPRVRVYFLLRPTYRVPARTELAAPGDVEPSPVAPPAPAADAGPTEAAPAAPAPQ
jgi:hypothetical protein